MQHNKNSKKFCSSYSCAFTRSPHVNSILATTSCEGDCYDLLFPGDRRNGICKLRAKTWLVGLGKLLSVFLCLSTWLSSLRMSNLLCLAQGGFSRRQTGTHTLESLGPISPSVKGRARRMIKSFGLSEILCIHEKSCREPQSENCLRVPGGLAGRHITRVPVSFVTWHSQTRPHSQVKTELRLGHIVLRDKIQPTIATKW